jgi:HEPN domain-containing protein
MSAMPPPSYRAWLQKAAHDITAINRVMVGTRVPWDIVCFHAQQAAEKVLKAFPVFHGQTPSKSHDCAYLLSECAKIAPSLAPLRADFRYVTRYGVAPRYPDIGPDPTKKQSVAAIAAMDRLRASVFALLPK